MKQFLYAATMLVASAFAFSSCNNGAYDANPKTNNSNVSNPLSSTGATGATLIGSWRVTADKETVGTNVTDLYASYPDCDKDDFVTFVAGGTVVFDEGPTKCVASDPQTSNGSWSVPTSNTLSVTDVNSTVVYDIISITGSELKLRTTITVNNVTSVYDRTLTKI